MKNYNQILAQVYTNLFEFIQYRKLVLTDETPRLSIDAFNKKIQIQRFITLKTTNENNESIVIVLLHNNTEISSKAAKFKKIIQSFDSPSKLIIISKDIIMTFINKQEIDYHIDNYTYLQLSIVVPKHELCSPHRILDKTEMTTLLENQLYKEKSNLPTICINDPMVIWIGGEIGDVVEIERVSELAGKALVYRRVTKDLLK